MARYIGPVCRLCRREAMKLFLKGERCYTEKCAIEKRKIMLKDLRDQPFLLLREDHCFRDTAIEVCKRARIRATRSGVGGMTGRPSRQPRSRISSQTSRMSSPELVSRTTPSARSPASSSELTRTVG